MSFSENGKFSYEYSEEERKAVLDKLTDDVFKRDIFEIVGDEVLETYMNFDSTLPGVEYNYYTVKHVLKCYEEANGDPDLFFEMLLDDYVQYYDYIADDEDVEMARWKLSKPSKYVGTTKETMEKLVADIRKEM